MALHVGEGGDMNEDKIPADVLELINGLKAYILTIYQPAASPLEATKRFSTNELFEAFSRVYHNELYFNRNDLSIWLKQNGFRIWDAGDMRFEWLLKEVE